MTLEVFLNRLARERPDIDIRYFPERETFREYLYLYYRRYTRKRWRDIVIAVVVLAILADTTRVIIFFLAFTVFNLPSAMQEPIELTIILATYFLFWFLVLGWGKSLDKLIGKFSRRLDFRFPVSAPYKMFESDLKDSRERLADLAIDYGIVFNPETRVALSSDLAIDEWFQKKLVDQLVETALSNCSEWTFAGDGPDRVIYALSPNERVLCLVSPEFFNK
jgi:hypothetical protein